MQNNTLVRVLLCATLAVGGVGCDPANFGSEYMMVDELQSKDLSKLENKELKVHGWVLAGSIKEEIVNQQTVRTFVLQKSGKKIRVFSKGPKPDTFKDQSEVIATGKLIPVASTAEWAGPLKATIGADAYVVEATELSAKCPSKYDGATANKDLQNTKFE